MPKVSVIIPVYNKEKYIADTLHSVLNQSFQDLEVIAVNDGSQDRSFEILRQIALQDDRLRIIDIPNGGVSHARNVGLEQAKGEWIQFLDADDRMDDRYLSQAIAIAEKQQADILFSNFIKENEKREVVESVAGPEAGSCDQAQLCDCFARWQYENGFFGFISNKLFHRELWETSGARFPEGTTLAEDLDFFVRLYPSVQNAYFWHGNSFYYLQTNENYMSRTTVDYCTQILIHMDIRIWFIKSGKYEEYAELLDKKVSEYAFFVLFHHEECQKTLVEAYRFLLGHEEILACLNPDLLTGFSKQIVLSLKKKNLSAVKILFAGRNMTRSIYRVVKRNV